MQNTKERIIDVSLELFSQKGFDAVSVRDICKRVNIKESSVYYHFKSKQAILDEILSRFEEMAGTAMKELEEEVNNTDIALNEIFFGLMGNRFFEKYLMDEFCNRVLRLLLIEQLGSEDMQGTYDRWIFDEPLVFQERMFSLLVENGKIKNSDSRYLAVKYYGPVYLFAQRWLFSGILSEERKQSFRKDIFRHIQKFFNELDEE